MSRARPSCLKESWFFQTPLGKLWIFLYSMQCKKNADTNSVSREEDIKTDSLLYCGFHLRLYGV